MPRENPDDSQKESTCHVLILLLGAVQQVPCSESPSSPDFHTLEWHTTGCSGTLQHWVFVGTRTAAEHSVVPLGTRGQHSDNVIGSCLSHSSVYSV